MIRNSSSSLNLANSNLAELVLLSVEDEEATLFLLETAVADMPTQVELHHVSDGHQALCFLKKLPPYEQAPTPDLILLDLNLPKLSGFKVLAELAGSERLRSIPVVVFTASSLISDKQEAMALGAHDYIVKPPSLDGFFEAVHNACARFAPMRPTEKLQL